jgi:hypothetical protein
MYSTDNGTGCGNTVAPIWSGINNTGFAIEMWSGLNCTGTRVYAGSPNYGFGARSMYACPVCRPN